MEEIDIHTFNGVKVWFDDEMCARVVKPNTISKYLEINQRYDHMDFPDGMFCAFSEKQWNEAMAKLEGKGIHLGPDNKLIKIGGGCYATHKAYDEFSSRCKKRTEEIKISCIPQEIYFEEYNNYEVMINPDGDLDAIRQIIRYWGVDEAKKIRRFRALYSIEEILNEDEK